MNGIEEAKPLHINHRDGIVKVTEKFNEFEVKYLITPSVFDKVKDTSLKEGG